MTPEAHDTVLYISKTWGAVYLFTVFVLAALWTYWPSRKSTYDTARQSPLKDEECLRLRRNMTRSAASSQQAMNGTAFRS